MTEIQYREKKSTLTLLVNELLDLLHFYFSQNWFLLLLEDIPGNGSDIHELCELISHKKISLDDTQQLEYIILLLDHFIRLIRRFLLPVLREKLRISGLLPEKQLKDKDERIKHGFIASVFPDNLERITHITRQIKQYLTYEAEKTLN
jgi:hypothetical protein